MKKTKIICSIGPASNDVNIMTKMVNAGMNVARLNFSHATDEDRINIVKNINKVREITGKHVGLLYDTKGPEFRNGMMENDGVTLISGQIIRIVKESVLGNNERFSVNYPETLDCLKIGNYILMENGLMTLEVISKEFDGITCKVITGGILGNKKSLNVPGINLNIPFVSEQDEKDIIYAANNGGNFLALSFVSSKEDILQVKEILKKEKCYNMQIIAKMENAAGIKNLDSILDECDGVMIARGDLGVEIPMEQIPIYQKMIIKKCREKGKVCIVATEMLETMRKNIRPTRAEVSDVANAVLDGADAVMLSGETAIGNHPVETVKYMANICENTEKYIDYKHIVQPLTKIDITDTIAHNVVESSRLLDTKLIVAATLTGNTARKISLLKPKSIVLATCTSREVAYSLSLNFGIYTTILPLCESTDEIVSCAIEKAKEFMKLNTDDLIIITGGFPTNLKEKTTNFLKIEKID